MQKYYFNTITKYSLFLGILISLIGCNVIFEKDISDEELTLIIPTNGQTYSTNQVHFKWEDMQGATAYQLEIVQPSFASIQEFVLDSLIEGNEFYYALEPGTYAFQISGVNSGYQSKITGPYTITIDSVSDLSNQVVQLTSPTNNYFTNVSTLTCTWQALYAADYYEFQLRSGLNFDNSNTTLTTVSNIYATNYTIPSSFMTEGEYAWGIRAQNQNTSSAFSSSNFRVDLTAPNDVTLLTPADNSTASTQSVVFKWDNGIDQGTVHAPVFSNLEIANDVNFSSILYTGANIYTDSLAYTFSNSGDYWWRVYAMDEAGNISVNYSAERKITIP
ncbi:MAG: hypothetical protein ACWA41_10960 [Putridiphycobacter sp.]